jgi:hypothetical protein
MEPVGQHEIDALRTREQGRRIAPEELEQSPVMLRALRRSARRELCWRGLGLRVH